MSEVVTAVSTPASGTGANVVLGNSDSTTQNAFELSETFALSEVQTGYEYDIDALNAYIAVYYGNTLTNVGQTTENASSLVGTTAVPMQSVKLAAGCF